VAVAVVAWALVVPPFLGPDERSHFGYVQSLAENGERPPRSGPKLQRPAFSTEERVARALVRNSIFLFDPNLKPAWEPAAEQAWGQVSDRLPRDDIRAVGPQATHPPLYYAYEAVPYAAASGGDFFDRLFAMRLWSGLLMLVTATGAWLLIGELVRDRLLQLAGAACVGLQPMVTFMTTGVNPDALLFATYSLVLWLAVRVARRGPTRWSVAGLVAATLAAGLTKAAGVALVRGRRLPAGRVAVGAPALGAAIVAAGLAAAPGVEERVPVDLRLDVLRGFATYLWDFYLPRLPFQYDYGMPGDAPWNLLGEQTWAAFGFLEVRFPVGVYVMLTALAVGVLTAGVAAVARGRFEIDRITLAVFGLTLICLFVGLHWRDFQRIKDEGGHVIQGRYFLPLMPIVGVAVAAALCNLRERARPAAAALVIGVMAALQLLSLSIVAGRFVA
jgi:hypothetical protein